MEIVLYSLLYTIMGASIVCILLCGYLFYRNQRVYAFQLKVLDLVSEASRSDINSGNFRYGWRYTVLNQPTYDSMVMQFWRPLTIDEWWDSDDFVTEGTVDPKVR